LGNKLRLKLLQLRRKACDQRLEIGDTLRRRDLGQRDSRHNKSSEHECRYQFIF
jgi:hypothetical protein